MQLSQIEDFHSSHLSSSQDRNQEQQMSFLGKALNSLSFQNHAQMGPRSRFNSMGEQSLQNQNSAQIDKIQDVLGPRAAVPLKMILGKQTQAAQNSLNILQANKIQKP